MAKKAAKSAKKKATSKGAKTAKKSAPRKSARTAPKKEKKPKADKVKEPETQAEVPMEQAADPLMHTQVDREVAPVQAEGQAAEPAQTSPSSTWEGQ